MTAAELDRICSSDDALSSGMDGPRDELLRQGLIDALVDLDLEYEREREVLRRSSLGGPSSTIEPSTTNTTRWATARANEM